MIFKTFRYFFFILCLPILAIQGQEESFPHADKISMNKAPDWVQEVDVPLASNNIRLSKTPLQYLLIDRQGHVEYKTSYHHHVFKILNQAGISKGSQLHIEFNPEYQNVAVHAIKIFRDGRWHDRLATSRYEVLQREPELESGIYRGRLSCLYFLDDVRVGDIIDYSWSIEEEDHLFSSKFSDVLSLEFQQPLEKLHYRLLFHPQRALFFKSFKTDLQPHITDLCPELREWRWEILSLPTYAPEENTPAWHLSFGHVQISEYQNWQEVAHAFVPLFTLPDDLQPESAPELFSLVEEWKGAFQKPSERVLKAIRFVQDEIRYLGFENGAGACKPTDPREVFKRRFGDCKDKSFLLQTLLKWMEIPSTLVLVDSDEGVNLPEQVPSPTDFNHVVLKIELEGNVYWVDATCTFQGGRLNSLFFPDYRWGLPIQNPAKGLIAIPQPPHHPIEVKTCYHRTSLETAILLIKTTYQGDDADRNRRLLQEVSLEEIQKSFSRKVKQKYGAATAFEPLRFEDARDDNVLSFHESYQIPLLDRGGRKVLKMHASTKEYFLFTDISLERQFPLALPYPLWVKEQIIFDPRQFSWDRKDLSSGILSGNSVQYSMSCEETDLVAKINYELRHLKDYISPEDLLQYWQILDEIEENFFDLIAKSPCGDALQD